MKSCFRWFNLNLLLAVFFLCAGCETTKMSPEQRADAKKHKKERTVLTIYLETGSSVPSANAVPIYRKEPVYVTVEAAPFLTLLDVEQASVIDTQGGFAIQLRFTIHGAFVLDTVTSANKGRRMAIHAAFPEPRWLAAPLIQQRNATGVVTFTPDATKEESERIVRGLNNAIAEARKRGSV